MPEDSKVLQKLVFDICKQSCGQPQDAAEDHQFVFIFGLAPEGLSEFEYAVSSMKVGDELELASRDVDLRSYMGRLFPMFCTQLGVLDDGGRWQHLNFRFRAACSPSPSEIVAAMADMQKYGGCSGSCDCGCH